MNSDFDGGFERLLWGIDLNAGSSRSTSHTSPKSLHKEAGNLQAEITQLVRELLQVLADLEVGRRFAREQLPAVPMPEALALPAVHTQSEMLTVRVR